MSSNFFSQKQTNYYWKGQTSHLKSSGAWTDDQFPPNQHSILAQDKNGNFLDRDQWENNPGIEDEVGELSHIAWKRIPELFGKNFKVFEGKIEAEDILQGNLGNCYFLSGIAAVAEYPRIIEDLFRTKEPNIDKGYYEVVLFIDGRWTIVPVDDYMPVNKFTNNLLFTRTNGREIWVILLEKAWAKVNGGYINISGGFTSESLNTLTGFPTTHFDNQKANKDELWGKILDAEEGNDIMCCSTPAVDDPDDYLDKTGLYPAHAYTLIGARAALNRGKKIRLVLIRNPHGKGEWIGDWSDKSRLWTPELKQKFNYEDKDNGTFWMSFEDYCKYFEDTEICDIFYSGNCAHFNITGNTTVCKPQVFNIFVEEKSKLSVSVHRDTYRFNRLLKGKNHPISVVIAKYDQNSKFLSNVTGKFRSNDWCEFIENTIDKGHYVVWVYYDYLNADAQKLNDYRVRFMSTGHFRIAQMKEDSDFALIKEIVLAGCKEQYADEMEKRPKFVESGKLKNTGIGYFVVRNGTKSDKFQVKCNIEKIAGYKNLPPFHKDAEVVLSVNPGGFGLILGIQTSSRVHAAYACGYTLMPKQADGVGKKVLADVTPFLADLSRTDRYYTCFVDLFKKQMEDYIIDVVNKNQESIVRQNVDLNKNSIMEEISQENLLTADLKRKFSELMTKLLELSKTQDDNELAWRHLVKDKNYYVGQVDKDNKEHGRGALVTPSTKYIGLFRRGLQHGQGKLYDLKGVLIYEGCFENGKYNGYGKLTLKDGERYDGIFANGDMNGLGTYYYANGSYFEGVFNCGFKHGKGKLFNRDGTFKEVEYYLGQEQKPVAPASKPATNIPATGNTVYQSGYNKPGYDKGGHSSGHHDKFMPINYNFNNYSYYNVDNYFNSDVYVLKTMGGNRLQDDDIWNEKDLDYVEYEEFYYDY
jgi:hypothetical protein